MAEAIRLLDERHDPDAFDINMGCPAKKITGGGGGSDLMRQPELATTIIQAVKTATKKPISVKTRLGWSAPTEILEFAPRLEQAGADLITIHGRTKAQGYAGQADWQMVGRAKKLVDVPVLVNGDVIDGPTAQKALKISGCDGLLIGRAALGNPWIFSEIATVLNNETFETPTLTERLTVLREHAQLHVELYGGDQALVSFRKHLLCYFKGWPGAKAWRIKLTRVSTLDELEPILQEVEQTK